MKISEKGEYLFPFPSLSYFFKKGTFFEPIRIIPTLIHEFAHVVRESLRKDFTENGKNQTGHDCHDDLFYECFKDLLVKAQV